MKAGTLSPVTARSRCRVAHVPWVTWPQIGEKSQRQELLAVQPLFAASHDTMQQASPAKQAMHSDHGVGAHDEHGRMKGFLGPYSMTREGS